MDIPVLNTPRLVMRGFAEADAEPMHRILSGADVFRYFPESPPAPPLPRVQRMIQRLREHWQEHGYGLWAVEDRETGALMGRCGLQLIEETGEVEVDFILGRDFWGKGFATEAGRASLRYGFETLPVESITGIVHPENMASRRVLEKLGMRLVEQTRYFEMDVCRYLAERPSAGAAKVQG